MDAGTERLTRLRRTLSIIWQSHPRLALGGCILVLLQAGLPILLLFLIKRIVDALAAGGDASARLSELGFLVGVAAAVALTESLTGAARRYVSEWQAAAVSERLHDMIHAKSVEVDLAFYEDAEQRDTLHRAQQLAPYRPNRLVGNLQEAVRNTIALAALLVVLLSLHWLVVPVLVLSSLPGIVLRMKEAPRYYDWWRRQSGLERLGRYLSEVLTTSAFAQELRLYSLGEHFRRRFLATREAMRIAARKLFWRRNFADFAAEAVSICGLFGIILLLGVQTVEGALTLGALVMSFQALQRTWSHFGGLLRALAELREDELLLTDLYRFLDLAPLVVSPPTPLVFPASAAPGIRLEGVHFRYPGAKRDALVDVTLEIAAGECVALVGRNGSGKSTLIKLIARLYDPGAGRVTIDGVDLRDLAITDLRAAVAVVSQDTVRYQDSAGDNIRYGARDLVADQAAMAKAAQRSGADEIIARLPQGLATTLGNAFEGGIELSPGEWQKIALARGLVREARLILLDEPTSAMDPHAEERIQSAFMEMMRGRTAVVISHRLSTVMAADRIHVLDQGRIVESGSHEELMRLRGIYAGMFEVQAARYRR
ncbi:MAG: ABC transporter ATP-binding protein [Burkholderiales bacterium]